MSKKLTLDDLIIEEHPGGQNCRSCPFVCGEHCISGMIHNLDEDICLTHTITLKPNNKVIAKQDLGDELCIYCPLEKKGVYGVNGGFVAGCEGSKCSDAYDNYLESNEQQFKNTLKPTTDAQL